MSFIALALNKGEVRGILLPCRWGTLKARLPFRTGAEAAPLRNTAAGQGV